MTDINTGDTAWVLISAALVLLMTPGLAFFYGGMVRAKSVLNMIMMSVVTMGTIGVTWVLFGYSMAFGNSVGGLGIIGNPLEFVGLKGLAEATSGSEGHLIPALAFVGFQAAFAIIAVALISGAVADRMKFGAWLAFSIAWAVLVYFPAAHWVFAFSSDDGSVVGGWIANTIKAVDFAGGTAIHINAGAAALALALVLGRRIGFGKDPMRPHNLTLVMLGAALLWFGWFGFNAGSALGANGTAAVAWVNTLAATAAAMIGWLITEKFRDGHPTSLGAASGIVAGLVAITPACATVDVIGAVLIGVIAGVACALAVGLKYRFGYDDSLDVVGVHLVGGLVGTLLIGLFANGSVQVGTDEGERVNGLFHGGGLDQLWRQAVGAFAVLLYSFVVSLLIALLLKAIMGLRATADVEAEGIDQAAHAETGYDLNPMGGRLGRGAFSQATAPTGPPRAESIDAASKENVK
ncbi:ammonia channel protein [Enemella dayhoffiae]|uniref:Ammonium transporter n=1 Tax=Enemella dayhoffiae TaxID=2016507 RepID=A0A255GUW4_9ACTN|nr:ammonium transporter [Enemella dayhoffiae]OYO19421.1 ammonia channel protein [Enemella dayhoffiae]